MRNNWLRIICGLIIGTILLGASLNKIDWTIFWQGLSRINVLMILSAIPVTVAYLLIKSWRWQILLSAKDDIQTVKIWRASVIGAAFNILLPYLGDAVRGFRVGQGKNKSFIFATIGLEKILDSILLLLILYSSSYFIEFPGWFSNGMYLFTGLVLIICAIILIFKNIRSKLPSWVVNILSDDLLESGLLLRAFLVTVLSWLALSLVYWIVSMSLGIGLVWLSYLFLVSLLYLGLSIPSAPGYIGSYQFFILLGLGFFGISRELALAYSFIVYLTLALPTGLLGWYYLVKG